MYRSVKNSDRAEWAEQAVQTFKEGTRMRGEDEETIIGDLLCDLMHYCRINGWDFADLMERAESHFEIEIVEDE